MPRPTDDKQKPGHTELGIVKKNPAGTPSRDIKGDGTASIEPIQPIQPGKGTKR